MKEILEHKNIIHILIILILYAIIILLLNKLNVFNKKTLEEVDNYSIFYTVSNSASLYLNKLASNDASNVYSLIDSEYIEENNITEENVIEKLKTFDIEFPSIRVTNMYQKKEFSNITTYYLKGNLIDADEDKYEIIDDYYLIVKINSKNNTYTITPYDGTIFKEDIHE